MRSEEKAGKLGQFGVKTAIGSLDDAQKLEELASGADVVFQCVSWFGCWRWCVGTYSGDACGFVGGCGPPCCDGGDLEGFEEEV